MTWCWMVGSVWRGEEVLHHYHHILPVKMKAESDKEVSGVTMELRFPFHLWQIDGLQAQHVAGPPVLTMHTLLQSFGCPSLCLSLHIHTQTHSSESFFFYLRSAVIERSHSTRHWMPKHLIAAVMSSHVQWLVCVASMLFYSCLWTDSIHSVERVLLWIWV